MKYIFILIFLTSSCQNQEDNKYLGQLVGAAVGAIVGSNVGSGTGKKLFTIIGSAGGFLIGGKLASLLSENDQNDLNNTIEKSLNENSQNTSSYWSSKTDENLTAIVTPIEDYKLNGYSCREFEKIIIKNKEKFKKKSKACRDLDGNWKISES